MNKPIPPAPTGWNKTITDLCAELDRGERRSIGSPEADWAREYERSLIASGTRYPRPGDIYEALADFNVQYLTSWAAPFTDGGEGVLRAGEKIVVDKWVNGHKPIAVYATAVNYAVVESRLIPAVVRASEKYMGYYLSIKTADLNQAFKLLHEESR